MPKNKDLKRLVRARMEKTGESYTAARARLLEKAGAEPGEELTLAAVAGYADQTVLDRTGKSWAEWVRHLDSADAASMPHREIAKLVGETPEVSAWWAQSVTVGYERIKGLRELGQRRGGSYDVNKSKTLPVPVEELYRAFSEPARREAWLPDIDWQVRTETSERSIRLDWADDTRVHIYFWPKGDQKSMVQIQHGQIASKKGVERSKSFWAERLTALAEELG